MPNSNFKINKYTGKPEKKIRFKEKTTKNGNIREVAYLEVKGHLLQLNLYNDNGDNPDISRWCSVTDLGPANQKRNVNTVL